LPALRTTFSEIKEELVKIENNIIPTGKVYVNL
jgi:hypothetical protein